METVKQIILAKSVNIFRRKSSSEQTKQSTQKNEKKNELSWSSHCSLDQKVFGGIIYFGKSLLLVGNAPQVWSC